MNLDSLVPGRLVRRYKRFLADVVLDDGREVVAHCPNTGSMRAVNVPGSRVWLSPSDNLARKLAWTWELIELPGDCGGHDLVSVHTGRTNAMVADALQRGAITELAGFDDCRREIKVGGDGAASARLDFRLDYAHGIYTYVEVKQVTLREADGHGYFPDAVSERGRKHLMALRDLAAEGHRSVLLFCAAHTGIADVSPAAHLDPAYAEALAEVAAEGVEILAYGCRALGTPVEPLGLEIDRRLPVDLERRYRV
ncbi:DNA/RNA nuclease SfsA [Salinicola rhizosphaerae]|uniref:Sugar fermentation stimulation protein homolog n=1 Tax=Salinicola rhizosphaerae TaxID=1443141 RepID=A0ABQ3DX81_9GAMM|nr:DNA/RNA nuclease SfsA [Salinicola rhizosphaerae]GHB15313.1 sugar fermentation stimulation protein [Salinicola rhizosphaerae]